MNHLDIILTQERAIISLDLFVGLDQIMIRVNGDPSDDDAFSSMWTEFETILISQLALNSSVVGRRVYGDVISLKRLLSYSPGYPEGVLELLRQEVRRLNAAARAGRSLRAWGSRQSSDNS